MKANRFRKTRKTEKGQSLVEFALVIPLLLLLVIGIFEFGRAWMTKNVMTGAAREAARMAAVSPPTGMDNTAWNLAISARANTILTSAGVAPATITVIHAPETFDPSVYNVTATVIYTFPVLTGFIPDLNVTLSSTTTMRREY
jgi:Flp pilus assembly protein TadG